jgi:hypothetical protein
MLWLQACLHGSAGTSLHCPWPAALAILLGWLCASGTSAGSPQAARAQPAVSPAAPSHHAASPPAPGSWSAGPCPSSMSTASGCASQIARGCVHSNSRRPLVSACCCQHAEAIVVLSMKTQLSQIDSQVLLHDAGVGAHDGVRLCVHVRNGSGHLCGSSLVSCLGMQATPDRRHAATSCRRLDGNMAPHSSLRGTVSCQHTRSRGGQARIGDPADSAPPPRCCHAPPAPKTPPSAPRSACPSAPRQPSAASCSQARIQIRMLYG